MREGQAWNAVSGLWIRARYSTLTIAITGAIM
jgi:hypothetical protein